MPTKFAQHLDAQLVELMRDLANSTGVIHTNLYAAKINGDPATKFSREAVADATTESDRLLVIVHRLQALLL